MKLQFLLTFIIYFSWLITGQAQQETHSPNVTKASSAIENVKAAFEQNKGQIKDMDNNPAPYVQYHYKQGNTNLFLLKTGIAYQFNRTHYPEGYKNSRLSSSLEEKAIQEELQKQIRIETHRMDMQLIGANSNASIIHDGKSDGYINYYNHNVLDVHSFTKITYKDIYPNIDWVIYTTDNGLKYDFIVHVGGDPKQIQMKFDAHENLVINKDGSFTLSNSMGSITEKAPVSFQGEQTIATQFQLQGNSIHFDLSEYDQTKDLIIDPSLVWATYYGGNDSDAATGCITDNNDNIYIAGISSSTSNIAILGHQNSFNGGNFDAMVVKFNANGTRQWATYYGGNGTDIGRSLAVFNDVIFLTGYTESNTNIATTGAYQTTIGGDDDAFLVKFDTNGTRQWATYYGGTGQDQGRVCSTDNMGNIILGGTTRSSTGISFNGHQNTQGGGLDAFLVKFNTNGIRQWSTYYGDAGRESIGGCTVDNNNNIFFSGTTASTTNIASVGSHQNTYGGGSTDAFLVKLNTNGVRQWSSYYGGTEREFMGGCAIDSNNDIIVTGTTASTTNIATNGIHQDTLGGTEDAFLVKFNTNGNRIWGTYYGGTLIDNGLDITIDISNNIFITGGTASSNSIAFNGHKNTYTGGDDVFLSKFNTNGLLQWGTYYGGGSYEYTYDCALDKKNNVYMVGETGSSTSIGFGGHQNSFQGGFGDAFLAKFQGDTCLPTTNNITRTACDSFPYHGITYLSSGSYTVILSNNSGCDSVVTLNLTILTTTSTDIQAACGSYTWINGITYTANNNTATDTLVNTNGCDSIITLDLTILNPTTSTDIQAACSSYTWIDGNTYTSNNNTATDTLVNTNGCDSIITLDLTILNPTTSTDVQAACGSYTWIDGNTYTSNNNSATDTLVNANGCDSIITLDLTILNSTSSTDVQAACGSYTWIDGNTYTSNNNSATDTLVNANGCDSIITLDLTILNPTTSTDVQAACGSYTWINGNTYTSNNNSATDTLVNANGCDSIITLNLTILNSTSSTDVQAACGSYTWIDGNTYTSSNNTATDTLVNANGCDSIITLDLTINTVDTGITLNGIILSANAPNASYQWINCDSNNAIIPGMSNQTFEPSINGNYAAIVTENGCVDTSACIAMTSVSINSYNNVTDQVKLYPNPTDRTFTIEFEQIQSDINLRIFSVTGQVIIEKYLENIQKYTLDINQPSGVYLVELTNTKGEKTLIKMIKK